MFKFKPRNLNLNTLNLIYLLIETKFILSLTSVKADVKHLIFDDCFVNFSLIWGNILKSNTNCES